MEGDIVDLTDTYPVEAAPPDPMKRVIINQVLPLGVKAVDGLLTVGKVSVLVYLQEVVWVKVHCLVCLQEIQKRTSM